MKTIQTTQTSQQSNMKRMSLIAILAVLTLMPALAQQKQPVRVERRPAPARCEAARCPHQHKHMAISREMMTPEGMALKKAQHCKARLSLNDTQYNQVFQLYKKEFELMDKAKKEGATIDQTARQESHKRVEKKMKKILSDVQFAQWKQMQLQHKQHQHKPQQR